LAGVGACQIEGSGKRAGKFDLELAIDGYEPDLLDQVADGGRGAELFDPP
jgi:hypothetical protein